ncbi:MAG TPA: 50S ribosomal protein L25 [Candidatus Eisenbacteria bacterium]|jgi:large subunit ribosomal protein L25
MSVIQLKGSRRERVGKGGARKARAAGQIPGVLYGHGETPVPVAVDQREFELALRGHKGGNAIVNLTVAGGSGVNALVRDVQYDPLSRAIVHLDFQHISLTEQIVVEVVLRFVGLPLGVKDGGGILEHSVRTLEVRCLPTAIPPSIDVDVTALNVGDSMHVRDLKAEGYEIVTDGDVTIAAVVLPAVEEVAAPAEAVEAAAATTAEPEVVGAKGKKDDEATTAEAGKEGKGGKEAKEPKEKDAKKEKK